ncbi:MAG: 1-deoxy-D-xylulose-5-phosphate reductoisomerase [Proteobacteria bacterium]|nr:1-deoxy-D-xylulose-5-phosphate reductoisomerase [Pseudomonadota bacterium]MBI3496884.1 1-deoxy-D-xylulose-5-phosphate reductoisomerase [Pseudomonadota bacterium]
MTSLATTSAPRRLTILGSTGSVGRNTVDLISRNREVYPVEALTARGNVELLIEQAHALKPSFVAIGEESRYAALKDGLSGTGIEVAAGEAALVEAGARPAGWVMAAIVGSAGLEPTLAAVRRGAAVALANKECLVCAGELVLSEMRRAGARLLPVDSEHNAIFQVFDFARPETVERIILTGSGGPFRTWPLERMAKATPAEAVAHPTWTMGAKISVDSATMMNKGLEIIEAHYLFGLESERIEVLIQPQSVIHSMVAYVDGSVLAQLGSPDMRTPIAHTLAWPQRITTPASRLDLAQLGQLTFERPEPSRFPALRLAREALQSGGAAPTILNAANEVAVHAFLTGRIGFLEIARTVERTLEAVSGATPTSVAELRLIDCEARSRATTFLGA